MRTSSLCNFLRSPVTSLLGLNIIPSTLFSNTPKLCSSSVERDQVSDSYKTTDDILITCSRRSSSILNTF